MQGAALEARPDFPHEMPHGQKVRAVREGADEQQPPRAGGRFGGLETVQIHAVGQHHGARMRNRGRVLGRHDGDAVHFAPGLRFEATPSCELPLRFPIALHGQELPVQIEGDVVLHQHRFGGRAIAGVLRQLGELELRDAGPPLPHGLAERRAERGRAELLHGIRVGRRGQGVAAAAPDDDHLGAQRQQFGRGRFQALREGHEYQVVIRSCLPHQLVHPHRRAVREREGHIGARDEHYRLAARGASGENRDVAGCEGEKRLLGTGHAGHALRGDRDAAGFRESSGIAQQPQPVDGLLPQPPEDCARGDRRRQETQVVDLEDALQFGGAIVARGGGPVPVLHSRRAGEDRRPAVLPGAIAQVEVLDVGGLEDFVDAPERAQLGRVVERAAAAAVEHPGQVLAGKRLHAAHGEVLRRGLRHDRLAGFLAARAGWKEDLGGGAKQVRDGVERPRQRGEEARLQQHVVVQQADM